MRRAIGMLSLVVCIGCNQVWGLKETKLIDATVVDRDGDGVPDGSDNCPDAQNPDQLDSDNDGHGDVCDGCDHCMACSVGPDHDEDGDRYPDGCDNCPTVSNPGLANTDGDDLGDACDPDNTTQQHRVLFDGFGALDPAWAQIGQWRIVNDGVETVDGPNPFGYRLTRAEPLITGQTHWTFALSFEVPASPSDSDSIGGYLVDTTAVTQWACTIVFQSSTWNVTNGIPQPIVVAPGLTKMVLSSQRMASTDRICAVQGNPDKVSMAFTEHYPMGVELYADRNARFTYVEVIQ